MKKLYRILPILLGICILFSSCTEISQTQESTASETVASTSAITTDTTQSTAKSTATTKKKTTKTKSRSTTVIELKSIPKYSGNAYVAINGNKPQFSKKEITKKSYEKYGKLDRLGRCTTATACIGKDLMPTAERGSIGSVRPTGWHTVKYSNIDGKYLYNRCHLIGYQLTAENANERNLITGTRYLNINGMLPFEDETADYIKSTGNHVMYRVTPIFKGDELVARGVQMEALSVEDNGKGVSFNVYCYNNQPGITIDYATGESHADNKKNNFDDGSKKQTYIVNINTHKFHKPSCQSVKKMKSENKKTYKGNRENLIKNGYSPCGNCNP